MSFKRLLYLAALVVGVVAFALSVATGFEAIAIGVMGVFLTVLVFWKSDERTDVGEEVFLFGIFCVGLISEAILWHWVIPLVLVVFFGTLAVTYIFS